MQKSSATNAFVIENCIVRYPHVFEPQKPQDADIARYSVKLYLDKNTAEIVHQQATTLAQTHFKNNEFSTPAFSWPVAPASNKESDAKIQRLADKYIINPKANIDYPPVVVDAARQLIMDRSQIYSGCIAAAGIRLFTYQKMGNNGVGVGLIALMKTNDGEVIEDAQPDVKALFANVTTPPPTQNKPLSIFEKDPTMPAMPALPAMPAMPYQDV